MESWNVGVQGNPVLAIHSSDDPPPSIPVGSLWVRAVDGTPIGLLAAITIAQKYTLMTKTAMGIKEIQYG